MEQLVVKMVERPLQINALMVWGNFHLLYTVLCCLKIILLSYFIAFVFFHYCVKGSELFFNNW